MQRVILPALAAIAVFGCADDITAKPLAAYDLTDRDVVNSVLTELSPQQRGPFFTFTMHHLASSKAFCGEVLVDKQGRQPSTIGDAIRMTIAREESLNRRSNIVDPAKLKPVERYYFELRTLQEQREALIDRREDMLMIDPDAKGTSRYEDIEAKIARSSQEIASLRATSPPGADLH